MFLSLQKGSTSWSPNTWISWEQSVDRYFLWSHIWHNVEIWCKLNTVCPYWLNVIKISPLGSWNCYFERAIFPPWPVNQLHVALARGPLTPIPPPPPPQLFVDHDWQDRAMREQFSMLLHNTTAVVLITLGFMTLGVWHERDSGKAGAETKAVVLITLGFMTLRVWHKRDSGIAGGRNFWWISQTRELKNN